MPYLDHNNKERLLDHMYPETGGELNYLINIMMLRFWSKSKKNYEALNTISGAATEALAEFRRRVVVPYEENKIKENGDIF